jgi:hypothetical protein
VAIRWDLFGISAVATALLLFVAIAFFRGTERAFADII